MDPLPRDPLIVGRKVFFVRPHSVIQKDMIDTLVQAEFEVGLLKDHTKAEALFRRHPDCIAFINIDEGYSLEEWDEVISRIRKDEVLKSVRLGIVTYNESPDLAMRYLMDLELPAGFVKLNLGLAASTTIILKVLEANEARGRRQFLRVNCPDEYTEVGVSNKGKKVTGRIVDLSVAGMACTLDKDPGFPARTPVQDLQVRLKGTLITLSAVLMGTRKDPTGHFVYIFVFNPKDVAPHKEKIRSFVQWVVQHHLDQEVKKLS